MSPAGEVRRTPVDTQPVDSSDLAYTLMRVLDDDGRAVGPWAMETGPQLVRRGLRAMIKTRIFDTRMLISQRQKKMSFYMQCLGDEAIVPSHADS